MRITLIEPCIELINRGIISLRLSDNGSNDLSSFRPGSVSALRVNQPTINQLTLLRSSLRASKANSSLLRFIHLRRTASYNRTEKLSIEITLLCFALCIPSFFFLSLSITCNNTTREWIVDHRTSDATKPRRVFSSIHSLVVQRNSTEFEVSIDDAKCWNGLARLRGESRFTRGMRVNRVP